MPTPRDLLDPRHEGGFGKAGVVWQVPDGFERLSAAGQDALFWDVRGALVQHETAKAFRRALDALRPRVHRDDLARRHHYSDRRLLEALRGQAHLRGTDVAFAVKALGTSALPHPSVLDETVRKAVQSARRHQGLRPGVLLRDQPDPETVMDLLGELGGVTVALPWSPAEKKARREHPALAKPYVRDACKRLRDRPGVAQDWDWQPWDPTAKDHKIEIRLARDEGGRPLADGGVDRPGFSVTVWLASDWATKVHAPGHAVLDGWFVLDTGHHDAQGRPTSALVLDLLPEFDRWARDDEGHLTEDSWQYRERRARIDWSGPEPTIEPL